MRQITRKRVVFDLDDVLGSFSPIMCQALVEITGDPMLIQDHLSWDQYDISHQYPDIPDFQSVFSYMEEVGHISGIPVIPESRTLCNALYDFGHEVIILTARAWMSNPRGITEAWLADSNVKYDQLIISPHDKSKAEMFPDGVSMYFEDNASHVLDCWEKTDITYIVDRPWNRSLDTSQFDLSRVRRLSMHDITTYGTSILQLHHAERKAGWKLVP